MSRPGPRDRREIAEVIDPARKHVAAVRSAIERSVASHAAYMLSGNPVLLARANEWRGLGLGLPIVKALVDAHGSEVEVESTVGQGTTFRFRIRAAAPARPATA